MKKIIITLLISVTVQQLIAQSSSPSSTAKMASIEESRKANGNAETTINGIPYSQYKAQQDALKKQEELKNQQQAAQKNKAQQQEITLTIPDAKRAAVKKTEVRKPVLATEAEVQQYVKENTKVAEKPKVVKTTEAVAPAPKLELITVTESEARALQPGKAQTAPPVSKVKATEAPLQGNPLFDVNANVTVGEVSTEANKVETPASNLPKPVQNQEVQKAEAEIPASVAPEKIKVPEKPSQGGGN